MFKKTGIKNSGQKMRLELCLGSKRSFCSVEVGISLSLSLIFYLSFSP